MLTPKGQRSFFSKECSNLPFLAHEAGTKKNYFDRTDCKIIMFEVERIFFLPYAW
jgi:hypothetical protein